LSGNMYEGVKTWNPLAGRCRHECAYCSTNGLRKRYAACATKYDGECRLVASEMRKSLGKGKTVFVCAQNDLFEKGVPSALISAVIGRTLAFPDNIYMFQTKNPARFGEFKFHLGCMLGTTIESNCGIYNRSTAPDFYERGMALARVHGLRTYVTIEPIMKFDAIPFLGLLDTIEPNVIFIGADSKHNNLPEPSGAQVVALVNALRGKYDVRLKPNLRRLAPSLFEVK
jgi:protein gp37